MSGERRCISIRGVKIFEQFLDVPEQKKMISDVRDIAANAPLFSPVTPFGKRMSVRMTSAGKYGWNSDASGHGYAKTHPHGTRWPDIPESILVLWKAVSGFERSPDCCLVNYYQKEAKMGMHQDRDEASFAFPVVSISLGDDARFRIGNMTRGGTTETITLRSGDVAVIGGEARLVYHGVDHINFGTSTLLKDGGRLNLTLRVVD
ncbi:MAG: alpha-ketoglutarate-dependent dioxygenase AlkB [Litoreibacter sp.]